MNSNINWKSHLLEFVFVTLGVLIAFGLNTCNENRKERALVQLYLDGLKEELAENKAELEQSLPYHNDLLDKLRNRPGEANLILRPAEVKNVAWELADNEVFKEHVDHDLFKTLSTAYQIHEALMHQHMEASALMAESNVLGPYYSLSMLGQELTAEEETLLEQAMMSGWIPIFETWTSVESSYLKQIDQALLLL